MKKFFGEFNEFALRGNVIDLAVGVIIGGAFQSIVKSLVDDLIMPFVGLATGGTNFNDQFIVLKEGAQGLKEYASLELAKADGATVFAYGSFITTVINFIIMAIAIFLLVKGINKLHKLSQKKTEEVVVEEPTTKICPFCKSEIAIDATRCAHCTSEIKE